MEFEGSKVVEVAGGRFKVAREEDFERVLHELAQAAGGQATTCAVCLELRYTPLRRDEMGGYVCLTCIDRRLNALARTCADCGAEQALAPCSTCHVERDEDNDDVGPGERQVLREVLGAAEGRTLVEAAQQVAHQLGERRAAAKHYRRSRDQLLKEHVKVQERRDRWRARAQVPQGLIARYRREAAKVRAERNGAWRTVRQLRARIAELEGADRPSRLSTFIGEVAGAAWKATRR